MIASLGRFFPALMRHIDAYGDIAGDDTREAVTHFVHRLLGAVIASGFLLLAAMLACVWLLRITWDKSWGAWVPAGLAALLAFAGTLLLTRLGRQDAQEALFPRVRREWRRDRELMERAADSVRDPEPAVRDREPAGNPE